MNSEDSKKKKKQKQPRELTELEVREVSLVDRPAIRREFLIVKRDQTKPEDDMSDEPTDIEEPATETEMEQPDFFFSDDVEKTEEPAPKNQEEIESNDFDFGSLETEDLEKRFSPQMVKLLDYTTRGLKAASATAEGEEKAKVEEAAKVLEGLLKPEKSSYPESAKAEDTKETSSVEENDEEKNNIKKENPEMEKKETPVPVSFSKREDGTYDLQGVPEEMTSTVEELCKRHDEAVQKAAELSEALQAEQDERLRRDFVEKAEKEYGNIPGSSAEVGLLLKSLHSMSADIGTKVEEIFKSVNGQLSESVLLTETGTAAGDGEASAWGRIEAKAQEMLSKGDTSSKATAISKVLELNPSLYQEYLKEGGN